MEKNRYIFAGALWIEGIQKKRFQNISDFGKEVADILGCVYEGIYHILKPVLHERVDWEDKRMIEIVLPGTLATYDSDSLTRLVIMCHKHAIRLEIGAAANGYLRLRFHRRSRDGKRMYEYHPSMEEAIDKLKKSLANSCDPEWGVGGEA